MSLRSGTCHANSFNYRHRTRSGIGILIKDAAQLEATAAITHIAFDKTGTLTQGIPTVTDAYYAENAAAHLPIALRLAQTSSHPLSIALVKYLKTLATTTDTRLEKVETIAGLGTLAHTSQEYTD
jgi:P-type E1-E2 ATPase